MTLGARVQGAVPGRVDPVHPSRHQTGFLLLWKKPTCSFQLSRESRPGLALIPLALWLYFPRGWGEGSRRPLSLRRELV